MRKEAPQRMRNTVKKKKMEEAFGGSYSSYLDVVRDVFQTVWPYAAIVSGSRKEAQKLFSRTVATCWKKLSGYDERIPFDLWMKAVLWHLSEGRSGIREKILKEVEEREIDMVIRGSMESAENYFRADM